MMWVAIRTPKVFTYSFLEPCGADTWSDTNTNIVITKKKFFKIFDYKLQFLFSDYN